MKTRPARKANTSNGLYIKRRTLFNFQSLTYAIETTLYNISTVLFNYLLSFLEFLFAAVRISLTIRQFLDVAQILDSGTQRKVTEGN